MRDCYNGRDAWFGVDERHLRVFFDDVSLLLPGQHMDAILYELLGWNRLEFSPERPMQIVPGKSLLPRIRVQGPTGK